MTLNNETAMTTTEAAKEIGVCPQTIKAWINRGVLKAWKVGNRYYVPTSALDSLAQAVTPKSSKKEKPPRV